MTLLELREVSKAILQQPVLEDISFSVREGEQVCVAGVTGSGKSSLLKMIAGLMQPDQGQIFFNGERVRGPEEKLIPGHPAIAYLSQHFELRNNYRVEELLEYANQLDSAAFDQIIQTCRIDHLLHRKTDQLSGGEKQRIATARLLIGEPSLLILDEPYSNLDMAHRQIMKEMIRDISVRHGMTCILVSHDPADTLSWADRMIVLGRGRILQDDAPERIYRWPLNAYVAGLLGPFYEIDIEPSVASGLLPTTYQGKGSLIIRPEQFTYSHESPGLPVIVRALRFAGVTYEITVSEGPHSYRFPAQTFLPAKGDVVFLRVRE
jgi:ABC-type sulfate/molybdate transport systems ATPase subunit